MPFKEANNLATEAAAYILADDTLEQVVKKINKGFCEQDNFEKNSVLDQFALLFCVSDVVKTGELEFNDFESLRSFFKEKKITP